MAAVKPQNTGAPVPRPTVRIDQAPHTDTKTIVEVKDEKVSFQVGVKRPTPKWLTELYNAKLFTAEELADVYDSIRYTLFDRTLMLYKIEKMVGDVKVSAQLIIACALRGPQAASRIKLKNGKTPSEMGIPGSGKMGTEDLSCQRIASSTADLAAFYMKILNVPKRIPQLSCPGWLQFPSAGSIKLPQNLREQQREFSIMFSSRIGGVFREDIYESMVANSYLDEHLNLFD